MVKSSVSWHTSFTVIDVICKAIVPLAIFGHGNVPHGKRQASGSLGTHRELTWPKVRQRKCPAFGRRREASGNCNAWIEISWCFPDLFVKEICLQMITDTLPRLRKWLAAAFYAVGPGLNISNKPLCNDIALLGSQNKVSTNITRSDRRESDSSHFLMSPTWNDLFWVYLHVFC